MKEETSFVTFHFPGELVFPGRRSFPKNIFYLSNTKSIQVVTLMSHYRTLLRNLIVGENQFILSHKHYKRILLTGQLCLLTFATCVGYLILDLISKIPHAWPYQLGCAMLALTSFILNRQGKFTIAKILLGLCVNLTVFVFSINEPMAVGLYMYFIVANLGALIAFGYEERSKAIFFVFFSTALFLISLFIHTDFIPRPAYTPEYVQINMIINFFGASASSAILALFLINANYKAEAQMMKREKDLADANISLTKVNTELDRFVHNTSHDLRAPLHSLQGLIQLTDYTNDPKELKEYVELMRDRVTNLEKFVQTIANYARDSNQALILEKVSVKNLIRLSLENLRFFPGSEKIKIIQQIPESLEITTDITRMLIVLNNLISNSLKYQDENKNEKFIKISAEALLEKLVLTIQDNGVGIPEDSIHKIFEMYARLHNQSFGSGLGLYIVKETVEKLRGKIQVQSKVGVGSTFWIEVPLVVTT